LLTIEEFGVIREARLKNLHLIIAHSFLFWHKLACHARTDLEDTSRKRDGPLL
jgi:hypothetical protein